MQKLTISLICVLVATALAVNDKKFAQITDSMRCKLCKDVVENEAQWAQLDNFQDAALMKESFKLCESVFKNKFDQLERLVCDDFATHGASTIREHQSLKHHNKNDAKEICKTVGFCV